MFLSTFSEQALYIFKINVFFQVENLALSRLRQAAKKNPTESEKVYLRFFLFTPVV